MTKLAYGGQSLSERVIEAIATELETSPLDLDPLYTVVDPDALDALFRNSSPAVQRNTGCVEFNFSGVRVAVDHDGSVEVSPITEDEPPITEDEPSIRENDPLHSPNGSSGHTSETIESE